MFDFAWSEIALIVVVAVVFIGPKDLPVAIKAAFGGGGRGVMVSQLMPGKNVGESYTTQMYLTQDPPTPEMLAEVDAQFKFLEVVVRDEDYATGLRQQRALEGGGLEYVLFGENEGGAQNFHQWVDRLIAADDDELKQVFAEGAKAAAVA